MRDVMRDVMSDVMRDVGCDVNGCTVFLLLAHSRPNSQADEIEAILPRLELPEMLPLMDAVTPKSSSTHTPSELAAATAALTALVATHKAQKKAEADRLAEDHARAKMLERQKAEEEAKRKVWSLEEISTLAKAIAKYPGAHPSRWTQITAAVNALGGVERTVKEVMLKSKEDLRAVKGTVSGTDAFSTYQARAQQKKVKHVCV
jgi:hypothetical protein